MSGKKHGNLGIHGSQRVLQSGGLQRQALRPDSPAPAARSGQARAYRKPRAWLARAEGKFQSPEAGPGGHHSVFSLGLLKQTTTKNLSENNNKSHSYSGIIQKRNKTNNMEVVYFIKKGHQKKRAPVLRPC